MKKKNADQSPNDFREFVIKCPVCKYRHSFGQFIPYFTHTMCEQCGLVIDLATPSDLANYQVLSEWRPQQENMSDELTAQVIVRICQALKYSHARGNTHGQLCPSLVYLPRDTSQKIRFAWLGETWHPSGLQAAAQYPTTPPQLSVELLWCMAPELFLDSSSVSTPTYDVYSLGVLLWYLTVGKWPSTKAAEILKWRCTRSLPLGDLTPLGNSPLNAVYLKATDSSVARRFQTIAEMHDALVDAIT